MFSRSEFITLALFCAVYVSWGLTDSIQAPFYPIEASKKGATSAEYGFVFGIIHLAIFFSGPIFGKYMHKLGVRKVYFFGIILTAVCALIFGTLDFIENKDLFLAFSYTLRTLEGIAEAASWSAVFAMLLHKFPNNVATIYSITEASFSFAEMIGPTFGAFLYQYGGFVLPFLVCGTLCLLTGLFTLCVLPNEQEFKKDNEVEMAISASEVNSADEIEIVDPRSQNNNSERSKLLMPNSDSILYAGTSLTSRNIERAMSVKSDVTARSHRSHRTAIHSVKANNNPSALWPVLSNKKVLIALSGTVFGASCQGLLEACLEPFLESFGLTITQIGFTFLALSLPYFIASPIWGHTCDHWVNPQVIQPIGHVITFVGFILLGPAGYIPENVMAPTYATTLIGLSLLGIGSAALLVASFAGAQKSALESLPVTPDDIYAVISGIWTSAFALGNFIGPTVGGLLIDVLGFAKTTTAFQLAGVVLLCLDIANLWCCQNTTRVAKLKRSSSGKQEPATIEVKYDLYQRLP